MSIASVLILSSLAVHALFKEFLRGGGGAGGGGRGANPNIFHKNRENLRRQGLPKARRNGVLMTLN